MAKATRKSASRRRAREAASSKQAKGFEDAAKQVWAQSQRMAHAWSAALAESVHVWSDLMRVSADTTTKAAKAFDQALKRK